VLLEVSRAAEVWRAIFRSALGADVLHQLLDELRYVTGKTELSGGLLDVCRRPGGA
jgi:hypothetical protein